MKLLMKDKSGIHRSSSVSICIIIFVVAFESLIFLVLITNSAEIFLDKNYKKKYKGCFAPGWTRTTNLSVNSRTR